MNTKKSIFASLVSLFFLASMATSSQNSAELRLPRSMAEMRADKNSLNHYLSGSVELKGSMTRVVEGGFQSDAISVFVRNGLANSWSSWFGPRKTSYYKIHRQTYGQNGGPAYLAKDEFFRGPINVEATEKGLAVTFYAPSPEGTTDFSQKDLRKEVIAYIHVPHERLYNKNKKINFVLANLMFKSESGELVARANADDVNGFFWAKNANDSHVFGGSSHIAVSDQTITKAKELAAFSFKGAKSGAQSISHYSKIAYGMAYSAAASPSAYDLAMMSMNVLVASGELYIAVNEAALLNPMALQHAKMAWSSSRNAYEHYNSFMGLSKEAADGQMAYLASLESIASQSYAGISKLAEGGQKAMDLNPAAIMDLLKAVRALRGAWSTYSELNAEEVAPAA